MGNSFLILFLPFGVILTLKGHGQGHFCYSEVHGHNLAIVRSENRCNKYKSTHFDMYFLSGVVLIIQDPLVIGAVVVGCSEDICFA